MSVPRVVVVGAGFAGLETARSLVRAPAEVVVVDRHNHHTFQPLLYQVATAALSPADIAWPVRSILRRQKNATVLMAAVEGVDVGSKTLRTEALDIGYDILVLATGGTHSYFGHQDWAFHAPGLKQIADATTIRKSLLLAFENAEIETDPERRRILLTFVVVGGGPTGVELAGAIAELSRHTLPADFRRVDPRGARVILVEAGHRILSTFPDDLSVYAHTTLMAMGVEVITSTPVLDCMAEGVQLPSQFIQAGTVLWAAGVIASPAAVWIGAPSDRARRIIVEPDLTVPGHPEIFAIGDTASVIDKSGVPVPGIAPAAKQMGQYVAKVISTRLANRPPPPPFSYQHRGDLATIGRKAAVVRLHTIHLRGFIGWLFWSLAHIYFLIGVRNRTIVAFSWLWNYITYQRGARLIVEARSEDSSPERSPER